MACAVLAVASSRESARAYSYPKLRDRPEVTM